MITLQANHKSLFQPTLGREVLEALDNLGPGSLSKVFLGWDDPWWEEGEGSARIARSRCAMLYFFADMLLLFLCLPKSKFLRKEREGKRLPEDWIDHIPGFAEVS